MLAKCNVRFQDQLRFLNAMSYRLLDLKSIKSSTWRSYFRHLFKFAEGIQTLPRRFSIQGYSLDLGRILPALIE